RGHGTPGDQPGDSGRRRDRVPQAGARSQPRWPGQGREALPTPRPPPGPGRPPQRQLRRRVIMPYIADDDDFYTQPPTDLISRDDDFRITISMGNDFMRTPHDVADALDRVAQ